MLRTLKKRYGPEISSIIPLDIWHWLLDLDLALPYYHGVSDQAVAHISGRHQFRTVREFKADLDFFLRHYTPVGLNDIVDHLEGAKRLPRRCFLLTFDDGFREVYDVVAPILVAKGIPAVFFLITSAVDNRNLCSPQKKTLLVRALRSIKGSPAERAVEKLLKEAGIEGADLAARVYNVGYQRRYLLDQVAILLECDFEAYAATVQPFLTTVQIKALMRQGFEIGAHSIDHPLYSELHIDQQVVQTLESVGWLSGRFEYGCRAFAFPFNDLGVSPEFFSRVFDGRHLKVTFGSNGMHRHFFPRNLERNTMESTGLNAKSIIAREFGVTFLRKQWFSRLPG